MSKALLDFINQNEKTYVEELRELLRKPSISAQNIGIRETADWIVHYMESLGMKAQIYPMADGHPVVFGELNGESDKSILFYNHYDVQPPEPLELWESEPFSADIRDGKIFSRGVADNKGCLMARLQAVKAILQTRGKLPVSVKFLVEGEEEIGSPHLKSFVDAHRDLLRSDLCIWENAYGDEDGSPTIRLGNKGMCYVELSIQSMKSDTHSKNATIYPNAAWEMIWALSTLKDSNENILIEGFYDRVVDPGPEEVAVIKRVPIQEEKIKARAGVDKLLRDVHGYEIINAMYNFPTCTVCGFQSGYTGVGQKTVLPAKAVVKLDMRLVPNQDPDDILDKLLSHFRKNGFDNIKIQVLTKAYPSKTPVTDPAISYIYEMGVKAYDKKPVIEPLSTGTGPRYIFSSWTDMPMVALGVSNAGSNPHAPNENIYLSDFLSGIKHVALIIDGFSDFAKRKRV